MIYMLVRPYKEATKLPSSLFLPQKVTRQRSPLPRRFFENLRQITLTKVRRS